MSSLGFAGTIWQDLRYGARLLRLNPVFTLVATLSLALGIGANTAIFQLLDAVRLRTLPVRNPQELAEVKIADRSWGSGNFSSRHPELTNPMWELIRKQQQAFSGIFAWSSETFNLARGGQARNAEGLWVSGEAFNVLGVPPLLGRVFTAADDRRGCGSPGVVISYPFWQREFGGQATALGSKLSLNGHPFEVIGVTPAGFFGMEVGRSYDVAVPICSEPVIKGEYTRLDMRHGWWLAITGRLKPGWTLARASAQVRTISRSVFEPTVPPIYNPDGVKHYLEYKLGAFPGGTGLSSLREDYEKPLWLLLSIAGLVLLIACANLANLMLARASAREREIAVRLAIGASRMRLIRQLLAESLLLAFLGAVAGALLASVLSQSLVSFLSTEGSPLFIDLQPDWRVLGFTAGLAVLTTVLFGLAPALRATRTAPGAVLKAGGRALTASRERFGLRRVLVVSQVALSLVLLVGALLFVRSLRNLVTLNAGFQQDGIVVAQVDFTRRNMPKERRLPFKRELIERIQGIPGVQGAADSSIIPISGNGWNQNILVDRKAKGLSWFSRITPGYFKTLGTPFLAGRDFDDHDSLNAPKAAIVNETFASKILGGGSPLGKTFHLEMGPGEPDPLYQVVGLVKDTKYGHLKEDARPIAFFPSAQDANPDPDAQILVRSNAPLLILISSVKRVILEANPDIDLDFKVFKTQINESLLQERLMATLSGFFGFLAALLATIGLYGVMSYMVAQRQNEIGVRMALGANGRDVLRMVLREAGLLLVIGLAVGTALAVAAGRAATSMLYGLKPHDPITMALAIASLAAVALLASYVPALRAARLEPMVALRDE
jgi:putative ABC transport system permease protein